MGLFLLSWRRWFHGRAMMCPDLILMTAIEEEQDGSEGHDDGDAGSFDPSRAAGIIDMLDAYKDKVNADLKK